MEITVNFDTADGIERTFRTCELNFAGLSATTQYREIYNTTKLFPFPDNTTENVHCITFYTTGSTSDLEQYFTNLPTSETDTNTLNNYANTFTFRNNEWYSDFHETPTNYERMTVGTMPDDWGANPHYMRSVYTYSALDGKSVHAFAPVSVNEVWNMAEQYFLDKTKKVVELICLKNGYKIAASRGYVSPSASNPSFNASIVGGAYTFEPFTANDPYKLFKTNYVLTFNNLDFSMSEPDSSFAFPSRSLFHGTMLNEISSTYIPFNIFISAEINNETYIGLGTIRYDTNTQKYVSFGGFLFSENFWSSQFAPLVPDWGDDTTTGGGQGTHNAPSDNRGDGTSDYFTDSSTGLVININTNISTALALNNAGGFNIHQILNDHMRYIYEQLFTSDYFQNWKNSLFNPLSAVLNVHMIPPEFITAEITGTSTHLTAAGFDISSKIASAHPSESGNVNYPTLQAVSHYHVGTIQLTNRVFDAFPDFAPYTTAILHLPYIGQIDIDVNAIMYGALSVDYVCDLTNGNCTAFVWCKDRNNTRTFKYIASGNCSYSIPLYAYSQDGSAIQKMINGAGSAIGGAILGNAAIAAGGIGEILDASLDAKLTKRDTQIIGTISGNNSMISDGVCWLEIIRPVWANPTNYQELHGETSELSGTLSADNVTNTPYSGLTIISEIDLDGVDALPDEKSEIEELLKSGVYIRGDLL